MLNAVIRIFVKILPILWSFRGESRGLGILSVPPFAIFLPSCQPLSWAGSFVSRKSHKPARTRKFKLHHHRLSRLGCRLFGWLEAHFRLKPTPRPCQSQLSSASFSTESLLPTMFPTAATLPVVSPRLSSISSRATSVSHRLPLNVPPTIVQV